MHVGQLGFVEGDKACFPLGLDPPIRWDSGRTTGVLGIVPNLEGHNMDEMVQKENRILMEI